MPQYNYIKTQNDKVCLINKLIINKLVLIHKYGTIIVVSNK